MGQYTVRSAYKLIEANSFSDDSNDDSSFWQSLLQLRIPQKIKNFLWQACSECLLTRINLQLKHVPVTVACPFCNACNETAHHLFVSCSFVRESWMKLGLNMLLNRDLSVPPASFSRWLAHYMSLVSAENTLKILLLCWSLWKTRNDLIWNQKIPSVSETVALSHYTLIHWHNARDRDYDFSLSLLEAKDGATRWHSPPVGTIKLNTDAALFSSPNQYSFSLVAKDHLGHMLEARTCCRGGLVSSDIAEAIGVMEALGWVKTKSWQNVVIESDALVVIQAIRSRTSLSSYFGKIIQDCRNLMTELSSQSIFLQFVKRSANTVAHYLAKSTCIVSDRILFRDDILSELNFVLLQDLHS